MSFVQTLKHMGLLTKVNLNLLSNAKGIRELPAMPHSVRRYVGPFNAVSPLVLTAVVLVIIVFVSTQASTSVNRDSHL